MRRLATLSTTLLASALAAACSESVAPLERVPDDPATITLVEPPRPAPPARELAVTSGVFAVSLADAPASEPLLVTRIDLAADPRAAGCVGAEHDAARTAFVGRVGADGRFTFVGDRGAAGRTAFVDCIVKLLEETPSVAKAGPAALHVDVMVRLAGSPCEGRYCEAPPAPEGDEGTAAVFGTGGLGLTGIGGSGGRGEGIGLGTIGTFGHGAGTGTGQGFGSGSGRLGGARAKTPAVKMGATSVNGRLPPEVVQRIVRQNFGRFRLCYENGLRNSPSLAGQVTVSFEIGRDGGTSKVVADKATDLPDKAIVNCVLKAFTGLSFPKPEGGVVQVKYPIRFTPGEEIKPPTVSGKRLHELAASDVEAALVSQGWKPSVVRATEPAEARAPFVVFAEKEGDVVFLTRRAGATSAQHELSVSADGVTLLGDTLTPIKGASSLGEIVKR